MDTPDNTLVVESALSGDTSSETQDSSPVVKASKTRNIKRGVTRSLRRVSDKDLSSRRLEFLRRKIKHEIAGQIAGELVAKYSMEFGHRGKEIDESIDRDLRESMSVKKKRKIGVRKAKAIGDKEGGRGGCCGPPRPLLRGFTQTSVNLIQ